MRCQCALWLRRLTQDRCRGFDYSRSPLLTLCVSDRSLCGAVQILILLGKSSLDFGREIALVVARCEFWYRSCNLLGTCCLSDHFRAVRCELWCRSGNPRRFVHLRSLPLWCGADFSRFSWIRAIKEILRFLWKVLLLTILQAFHGAVSEVLYEDLDQGFVQVLETMSWRSWSNPVRGPCMILYRSFWEGGVKILLTCSKKSLRDLAQVLMRRSCGDPCEVLFKRPLRDPVQVLNRRSCGDPGEILSKRPLHEDLADAMYQTCLVKYSTRSLQCMILYRPLSVDLVDPG